MKKSTSVIRFFETHRWLLSDPRFEKEAHAPARGSPAARSRRAQAKAAARAPSSRAAKAQAERRRLLALVRALAREGDLPRVRLLLRRGAPGRPLRVRLQRDAQNGQYLGLFQMGSSERRLFGHGETALEQAQAAYRYFVRSGRDWSPWSCKPWY